MIDSSQHTSTITCTSAPRVWHFSAFHYFCNVLVTLQAEENYQSVIETLQKHKFADYTIVQDHHCPPKQTNYNTLHFALATVSVTPCHRPRHLLILPYSRKFFLCAIYWVSL